MGRTGSARRAQHRDLGAGAGGEALERVGATCRGCRHDRGREREREREQFPRHRSRDAATFAPPDARVTASMTSPGVSTAGRSSADALVEAGYTTYNGTPLRPNVASTAVISASRDVQSARNSSAFAPTNARSTASECRAIRSDLTAQAPRGRGVAAEAAGDAFCDPITTPPAPIVPTSNTRPTRPPRARPAFCARPAIHPVSETATANNRANATKSVPACRPNTHSNQTTVAYSGKASSCFSVSNHDHRTAAGHQHVVGLDVTVHDTAFVRVGQRRRDVAQHAHRFVERQFALLHEARAQRFALDQRHREVGQAARIARRPQGHDVRMLQPRGERDLTLEALDRDLAGHLAGAAASRRPVGRAPCPSPDIRATCPRRLVRVRANRRRQVPAGAGPGDQRTKRSSRKRRRKLISGGLKARPSYK